MILNLTNALFVMYQAKWMKFMHKNALLVDTVPVTLILLRILAIKLLNIDRLKLNLFIESLAIQYLSDSQTLTLLVFDSLSSGSCLRNVCLCWSMSQVDKQLLSCLYMALVFMSIVYCKGKNDSCPFSVVHLRNLK